MDEARRNDNSVVHVVTTPWHEGNEKVTTESKFAIVDGCTFDKNIAFFDFLTTFDFDALIVTTVIIGLFKVNQFVFFVAVFILGDDDGFAIGLFDGARSLGQDELRGVLGDFFLDAGADNRAVGSE